MALGGLLALADRRYRMAARREERAQPAATVPAMTGIPVQGPAKGGRGVQGA
jgi:hypothetical protein